MDSKARSGNKCPLRTTRSADGGLAKTEVVRVIIQKAAGFIVAGVLCLPLAAQEGQVARSESGMAWAFGNHTSQDTSASEQRDPPGSAEQSEALAHPVKAGFRDAGRSLNIFVLVGNRAVNSIHSRFATAPVIEVRDEQNLPIQGAEVVFQLPAVGPSGFFTGQKLTWAGRTDANGQAVPAGFSPNHEPGRFGIRVTASYGGRVAHAIIAQTNLIKPASPGIQRVAKRSGWWKVAAVGAAGGAAGGIVWATRRKLDRPTVILQPGTVSFGGPR